MIRFLASAALAFAAVAQGATKKPKPARPAKAAWEAKDLQAPESAVHDGMTDWIYVSNIGTGGPLAKDGDGWIQRFKPGNQNSSRWVTGLNAPKGLAISAGTMWVADIDQILGIETATGRVLHKISPAGAKFLNDVAVHPDGRVFVSDTTGSKIYVVEANGEDVSVFMEGDDLESPNGLLVDGDRLLVAAWGLTKDFSEKTSGHLYEISIQHRVKKIIPGLENPLGNLDGLVRTEDGRYLVSDWLAGKVFEVANKGKKTHARLVVDGLQGAADLGYIPGKKALVLVPEMNGNGLKAVSAKF